MSMELNDLAYSVVRRNPLNVVVAIIEFRERAPGIGLVDAKRLIEAAYSRQKVNQLLKNQPEIEI